MLSRICCAGTDFYPRPPRGGRPRPSARSLSRRNFYPRPPRGGRLPACAGVTVALVFLSTPSARRATSGEQGGSLVGCISIHALREEGDLPQVSIGTLLWLFLSTPSARRATKIYHAMGLDKEISIHALREEGDTAPYRFRP